MRGRSCGVGEHTDGRWVAKADVSINSDEMRAAPCCHFFTPGSQLACGPKDVRAEFWPWKEDASNPHFVPPDGATWFPPDPFCGREDTHVIRGRSDFLVHAGGNACRCRGWVDQYVWEPKR